MADLLIRPAAAAAALAAIFLSAPPAMSAMQIDMAFAWPPSNFNVRQAEVFADRVREATDGEVDIVIHAGGALGIKGPDTLRAIREGTVPLGGMSVTQNSGDEPFFLLYSVPFLVTSFEEAGKMASVARPVLEDVFEKHNQKLLYHVLWPAQIVYSADEIVTFDDLAGFKLRTADRGGTLFFEALGSAPIQLPWGEVVPALATGLIEGVTTSSTSGIDGKFWEFVDYVTLLKWNQSPEAITINLDTWNQISPEHQAAILEIASELEPKFQAEVMAEDNKNLETMKENGMTVNTPSDELTAAVVEVAIPFWERFVEEQGGPDSTGGKVIAAYRELVGK